MLSDLPSLASPPRRAFRSTFQINAPQMYSESMTFSIGSPRELQSQPPAPPARRLPPALSPRAHVGVSPRDRMRRRDTLPGMEDLQWPPRDDVRWGPRHFVPFALPGGPSPEVNPWTQQEPAEEAFDIRLPRGKHRDDVLVQIAKQHISEDTIRIEEGLERGSAQFGEWLRGLQAEQPVPAPDPHAAAEWLDPEAYANQYMGAYASASALASALESPRRHAHDGGRLGLWLQAIDAERVQASLPQRPNPAAHEERRPNSRTRFVSALGQYDLVTPALLRGIEQEAGVELRRVREQSERAHAVLRQAESNEAAWWEWYEDSRQRIAALDAVRTAEEAKVHKEGLECKERERKARKELEQRDERERRQRAKAERERVEKAVLEQKRLGEELAIQARNEADRAAKERAVAKRQATASLCAS